MEVDVSLQNSFGGGADLRIQVYTMPGAYRSFIHTPDDWTILADTTAVQVPEGGILIPAQDFDTISLPAQQVRSFYVAMNGAYLDSRSFGLDKTGEIDADLGPLLIYTGAGAQSKFPEKLDTTIAPKFSGVFHYSSTLASCDAKTVQTTVEYMFNVEGSVPFGSADPLAPVTQTYIDNMLSSGLLVDFATYHQLQRIDVPYTRTSARSTTCSENCYSTTVAVTFEHATSLTPGDLYEVLYGDLSLFSVIVGEALERVVVYSGPVLFETTFTFVLNGVPSDTTMNDRQLSYFQQQLRALLNEGTRVGVYTVEVTDQTLPLPDKTVLHVAGTISGAGERSSTSSVTDSLDEIVVQQGGRLPRNLLYGVLRSSSMEREDAAFFRDISSVGWSADPVELEDIVVPTMAPSLAPVADPAGNVVDVAATVGKGLDSLSDSAKDADAGTWFLVGVISSAAFLLGIVIVLLTRCHASRSMLRVTPKGKKIPNESTRTKSTAGDESKHKPSQRLGDSCNLDNSHQGPCASPRPMRRVTRSHSMNGPLYANDGARGSSTDPFPELSFSANSQRQPSSPCGRSGSLRSQPIRSPSHASMRSQNSWRVGPPKQQQHPLVSPQRTFSRQPVSKAQLMTTVRLASPKATPRPMTRNPSFGNTASLQRFPPTFNRSGDLSYDGQNSSPNFRAFSPGRPGPKPRIQRQNSLDYGHPKQQHQQRQHPLVSPQRAFNQKTKIGNQNVQIKQLACPPESSRPISRESSFDSVSMEQVGNIDYPARDIQRGTSGSPANSCPSRSYPSPMHRHPKLDLAQASPSPMIVSSPVGRRTPGLARASPVRARSSSTSTTGRSPSFRATPQRSLSTNLSQPNRIPTPQQSNLNGTHTPVRSSIARPASRSGSIGCIPPRNGSLRPPIRRSASLDLSAAPASPGKSVPQKQLHGSFSSLASNNVRRIQAMASPHQRGKPLVRSPQHQSQRLTPMGPSMGTPSSRPGNGNFRPPISRSSSMAPSHTPASPDKSFSHQKQHGNLSMVTTGNVRPPQAMVSPHQRDKQLVGSPQRKNVRPVAVGSSMAVPSSRPGSKGNSTNNGNFRAPITHSLSMDLSHAPASPGRHQRQSQQRRSSSHRDPPNRVRSGSLTGDDFRPQSIQESKRPVEAVDSSQQRGNQHNRTPKYAVRQQSADGSCDIPRQTPSNELMSQSKGNRKTLVRRNSADSETQQEKIVNPESSSQPHQGREPHSHKSTEPFTATTLQPATRKSPQRISEPRKPTTLPRRSSCEPHQVQESSQQATEPGKAKRAPSGDSLVGQQTLARSPVRQRLAQAPSGSHRKQSARPQREDVTPQ